MSSSSAQSKLLRDRTRSGSTTNTCRITRAVQTISSLHRDRTWMFESARKYFHSPHHFPKILGGLMVSSGIAGYMCMGWWHERQVEWRNRIYIDAYYHQNNHHNDDVASPALSLNHPTSSTSNATAAAAAGATSGSAKQRAGGRNDRSDYDDNNGHTLSLARKMTRRIISTSPSTTTTNIANSALFNALDSPLKLQRHVTKFWWWIIMWSGCWNVQLT